jgi:hypothetical protein
MQVQFFDQTRSSGPLRNPAHERYGPYFVFPQFRCTLDFGGARSFELLIAAFCDPRVVPQQKALRRRLNGVAAIWHGPQHEIIILEGLEAVDRANLQQPTRRQVAMFRRLASLSWADFSTFCRSSPATCPSWRRALPWSQLEALDTDVTSAEASTPQAHAVAISEPMQSALACKG